ncbi:hypothetical protein HMPREF1016_03265 [Bacteroides eggerthii 1_2_48FAA]|uniref:Uncharacterized protein n=1 Tax=Bacteroides eggerthii 1_2_48FAA TaxID=665953 RepID=E5X2V8_9BACE|nr:hypothetical protein HMPREF1016_03265 [Bacteroides eggerthii 1_2_48FAA]
MGASDNKLFACRKEEQNKRGNEYNKKAVPHLWKHKNGTASYFLEVSGLFR